MMLDPQLAQKIVNEVRMLLDESIIVINSDGVIIASTDGERIGCIHEGARIAIRQKKEFIITKEIASQWRHVRDGINLPIFFQHNVIGVIGITGHPEKISPYGQLMKKMTELLIQESFYQDQLDFQTRALEGFVFEWITKRDWNDEFFNKAKILNINLHHYRQAVLLHLSNPEDNINSKTFRDLINVLSFDEDDVIVRWGNDHLLIIVDTSIYRRNLKKLVKQWCDQIQIHTGHLPMAGVGSVQPAHQLVLSFQQAERALHATSAHKPIMFDEELILEMIIEDLHTETKQQFIKRTIAPILDHEDILKTLHMLCTNEFSYKQTAEQMHIHINTLHYRLGKLEQLTRLNTKMMKDRVVLYLAWLFLDEQTKN